MGGNTGVFGQGADYGLYGYSGNSNGIAVNGLADGSGGTGLYGVSDSGIGTLGIGNPGLEGRSTAYPLILTNETSTVLYVDSGGNLYYHGALNHFAIVNGGATVTTSSPTSTRPAIEDTGTARLVKGLAIVRLDADLARAMDSQRPYQVFLTPDGDTRGLYIASKSAVSFVVREVQGGHGTFDFDYHVYAGAASTTGAYPAPPKVPTVHPPARPIANAQ